MTRSTQPPDPVSNYIWQPSCDMSVLKLRADMLHTVRTFFRSLGYTEVETPCLSRDIVLDAWLTPFEMESAGERWFLQTSPEAGMKRLLAAGSGSIFQISRVFRSGESGARHNPEFTMIEWYGVNTTWRDQIRITEALVRACLKSAGSPEITSGPFRVIPYQQAFLRSLNVDPFQSSGETLIKVAAQQGIELPPNICPTRVDDILNVLLAVAIEPDLGNSSGTGELQPEFLCDYPPSQAALAKLSDGFPLVARRFELYLNGLELCNGYEELTDAGELLRREHHQNTLRQEDRLSGLPGAPRLAAAMHAGLPACSGVAMGFDRLVMAATSKSHIADVMPFSADRA